MVKRICFALCVLLIMSSMVAYGADLGGEVIDTGYGPTKQAATNDALRNAIERVVGTIVDARTLTRNNIVIRDLIYAKATGYVRNYSIIDERQRIDGYSVTVKAYIDNSPNSLLRSKLEKIKNLEVSLNNPRIGVVIAVDGKPSGLAENSFVKRLLQEGITQVYDSKYTDEAKLRNAMLSGFSNDRELMALYWQQNVDYIVVGNVTCNKRAVNVLDSGLYSLGTQISFKLINVSTGAILYSDTLSGGGAGNTPEKAMYKGVTQMTDLAAKNVADALYDQAATATNNIRLMISGDIGGTSDSVTRILENIHGVKNVYLRSQNNGLAVYDVAFSGTAPILSLYLESEGFAVNMASGATVAATYRKN